VNNNYISEIRCFKNENVEEVTFEIDNNEIENPNKFFRKIKLLTKV
jgi:hypothetical protein